VNKASQRVAGSEEEPRRVAGRRRATIARDFETYVERVLAPSPLTVQITAMDNLGAHKPRRIRKLTKEQGCELPYLPAYSPDYNLSEEAFSKIKNLLCKIAARSKEALVGAIGAALLTITAEKARGQFKHAEYHLIDQLL